MISNPFIFIPTGCICVCVRQIIHTQTEGAENYSEVCVETCGDNSKYSEIQQCHFEDYLDCQRKQVKF